MATPYEKMYLIDEAEYMKLKHFDYPRQQRKPQQPQVEVQAPQVEVQEPQVEVQAPQAEVQAPQVEEQFEELHPAFQQLAFEIPTAVDLANNNDFLNETINVAAYELVEATQQADQYNQEMQAILDDIESIYKAAGNTPQSPEHHVMTFDEHQWNNLTYEEYRDYIETVTKERARMEAQDPESQEVIDYYNIMNMLYTHQFYLKYTQEKA